MQPQYNLAGSVNWSLTIFHTHSTAEMHGTVGQRGSFTSNINLPLIVLHQGRGNYYIFTAGNILPLTIYLQCCNHQKCSVKRIPIIHFLPYKVTTETNLCITFGVTTFSSDEILYNIFSTKHISTMKIIMHPHKILSWVEERHCSFTWEKPGNWML